MVTRVISDEGDGDKSNHYEGMEEAKEGSSAPGTHWSTGGREGGGNIWRLENQGKEIDKELYIVLDRYTTWACSIGALLQ